MTVTASSRTATAGHGRSRALLSLLAVPCVVFGLAYVTGATTAPASQGQARAQAARLLGAPPKVIAVAPAAAVPSLQAAPRARELGHRAPATTTPEHRSSPAPATTGGSPPVAATASPVTAPLAPTVTNSPAPAGGSSPRSGTGSGATSGTGAGRGGSAHSGSGSEGDSAGTGSGGG